MGFLFDLELNLPPHSAGIIWPNAELLSIRHLGTNLSEIFFKIQNFSFTKMHLKMRNGSHFVQGGDELSAVLKTVHDLFMSWFCWGSKNHIVK